MVVFACISPHPPVLMPDVGTSDEKELVKNTLKSLGTLRERFVKADPTHILIASPHEQWGFDIPLHFIAPNFQKEIETYLTETKPPRFYFEQGQWLVQRLKEGRYALIASADLSHRLKEKGSYGFHPDGPKFDKKIIELLKKKDSDSILKLARFFPNAAECGLRPLAFILGVLKESNVRWKPEILSYENPFGVGYLAADLHPKRRFI